MSTESRSGERGCILCGSLSTPVLRESRFWRTALNRNQNLLGKLIIVLKRHEEDVSALRTDEWIDLRQHLRLAVTQLREAFAPDHFNYAFLQNQDRHVHLHVIPRYATARRIGSLEFDDPDYPDMFRVRERIVEPNLAAKIAAAILSGRDR